MSTSVRSVLICGASGFIGGRVVRALREAGLSVTTASSRTHDFTRAHAPADWVPHLAGFDAVINAVGVLRETRDRPLDALHHRAPAALFEACAQAGVSRVLQISANGVATSDTRYATSKRAADEVLMRLRAEGRLDGTVLRPSIVFGRGGASSALFMSLAKLPVLVLPAAALSARVQPVAVPDVALACLRLLQDGGPELVTAVGPQALPLSAFIGELRRQLGHGPARVIPLPDAPSRWSALVGDRLPFQPWSSESLSLLQQDNVGDAATFARLLGRAPVPLEQFVEATWRSA
ncbi:Nucleoside-diphosphate-sugar epimerase [Roseateles sp. YR242]|uniref:NAD-dependent epimerase/dehydratase family protein n=1 Tax=Roseateles sp. YR242 TaxID=1855305 RepID=UPI0008B5AE40|nr:NAD-dependent epimerase/dehydratase family protein [Roseateles sp. YR242]SEL67090.1 Nucleoside-diphosphate-sugar epimerase [Roseateles sp. YR242]